MQGWKIYLSRTNYFIKLLQTLKCSDYIYETKTQNLLDGKLNTSFKKDGTNIFCWQKKVTGANASTVQRQRLCCIHHCSRYVYYQSPRHTTNTSRHNTDTEFASVLPKSWWPFFSDDPNDLGVTMTLALRWPWPAALLQPSQSEYVLSSTKHLFDAKLFWSNGVYLHWFPCRLL